MHQRISRHPLAPPPAILRVGGLANVQGLRALAAMLVVVVHMQALAAPLGLGGTERFGCGVDLFFVISGFIMVYTTGLRPPAPGRFLASRVARILPFYAVMTLGVAALAAVAPGAMGGTRAGWLPVAKSLAFIPYARADGLVRPVLFVGWSLNLEMLFYLIFACALRWQGAFFRAALVVAMLVGLVAMGRWRDAGLGPVGRFMLQPLLLEFALGVGLGVVFGHLPARRVVAWAAVAAMPVGLGLMLALGGVAAGGWPVVGLPAAGLVLAALVAQRGGLALASGGLTRLGDASYALYLTHPLVTQAMARLAQRSHGLTPASAPVWMLATMAAALAVGLAAHHWVEQPLSRLARRALPAG